MAEDFQLNVLKLISAEIYALLGLSAAREMYGKSYFSLGVGEKAAVGSSGMEPNLWKFREYNSCIICKAAANPDSSP